ncbi:MAG: EAL domain-containing protein [Thiobacillus sp.]|nr:EAL domain-containing protein [Thiobacillus sp.]
MGNPLLRLWDRIPFVGRLLVTASLALLIAGSVMLYSSAQRDAEEARTDLDAQLQAELNSLPPTLAELLVIGDFASLQQSLDRMVRRPLVASLVYRDTSSGAVLSSHDEPVGRRAPAWFSAWMGLTDPSATTDAVIGGRSYGSLTITLTAEPAVNRAWTRLVQHLAILALAIGLDFVGIWLILHSGLRPLRALDRATRALETGDLSARVAPQGSPELRHSIETFNGMAAAIAEARAALTMEKERLQVTLASIGDAVMTTDADGRIAYLNPVAEQLTGWDTEEVRGRPLPEVFRIVNETTREPAANPVERVFREGLIVELANHTLLIARDGSERPIADSAAPIRSQDGSAILGAVLVFRDQTQERAYLDRLQENEQKLNTILDNVEAHIFIKDADYRYQYANRQVRELFGRDVVGHTDADYFDAETAARLRALDRRVIELGERVAGEEDDLDLATGEQRSFLNVKVPLRHEDGSVYAICGVSTDITARKRGEDRLRLAASVFEHAQEGILITDADARILDVNPAFCTVTGYDRDEVIGHDPSLLKSGHHPDDFFADLWASLLETGAWRGEIWNRKKSGELFVELLAITAVPAQSGGRGYYVGVFTDITQIKAHQQHLEQIAHYDALTQLPNRVLLADRLHVALAQTRRGGDMMAVCYLDLDEFKPVNDNYGHEAGDQLLVEVANRLTLGLRAGDTVARLGGDEFVILLAGLKDLDECRHTLDRLLRVIASPYEVAGHMVAMSASIGVAVYPLDDTDPDTLLRHADQSMYVAKESGRNRYHLFDPEHDRRARVHREAMGRIQEGLAAGEFRLHYQPKVNLRQGKVVGAEALIRWQHPERGLLPPADFLSLIDETELSATFGNWVIETALAQMEAWRQDGLDLAVSVNISARHLQSADFTDQLAAALSRHIAVPAGNLELEILETSALDDLLHITGLIDGCRRLGVSFALDDFGTGYSSLSYLKRLPAETLKIDQSFVRDMLRDSEDLAIVDGIIGLAQAFKRQVIAEGVEEIEHGILLLHLGCDLAQGYAIARPMPADAVPGWVAGWRPHEAWRRAARMRYPKQDLPILIAGFDHSRWIDALAAWLQAETEAERALPPLNPQSCRFGRWYHGTGGDHYGDLPEFRNIKAIHERVHTLARELAAMKMAGHGEQAVARLGEMEALRLDLLDRLEGLSQSIVAYRS